MEVAEEAGYCGHFKCVANYPMSFDVMEDGTLQFLYVRVIMPDGVDIQGLDGKTAHLRVEHPSNDDADPALRLEHRLHGRPRVHDTERLPQ